MLNRIKNILLSVIERVPGNGLGGKAGACVFFFHYARVHNQVTYNHYALELLETLLNIEQESEQEPTFKLGNGLTGIGWAMIHIYQEGFIDTDIHEVLLPIDERILQRNHFIAGDENCSLETWMDTAIYWAYRLQTFDIGQEEAMMPVTGHLKILLDKIDYAIGVPGAEPDYLKLMMLNEAVDALNMPGLRLTALKRDIDIYASVSIDHIQASYWLLLFSGYKKTIQLFKPYILNRIEKCISLSGISAEDHLKLNSFRQVLLRDTPTPDEQLPEEHRATLDSTSNLSILIMIGCNLLLGKSFSEIY